MEDLKPWWTSKSIWTGVIATVWSGASAAGVLPEGLSQADVLNIVLALTGVAAIVFRKAARTRIA